MIKADLLQSYFTSSLLGFQIPLRPCLMVIAIIISTTTSGGLGREPRTDELRGTIFGRSPVVIATLVAIILNVTLPTKTVGGGGLLS